ncbi:MAG TPA: nidogen-like domain-containing protein [Gemmataceae bacterium]
MLWPTHPSAAWSFGAVLLLVVLAGELRAGPVRPAFDQNLLPRNDDESSGEVPLGFTANLFGESRTGVFVNNNGNITFGEPLAEFTPFDLTSTHHRIIAPFFADVDTTARGTVSYGTGLVDGHRAFAATWTDVGYYNARSDKTNTFQVVLIEREDIGAGDFDIEFNYDQIQWESGDFSGGVDGFGGASARVGYSNGTGIPGTAFELAGSAVNSALLDGGPAESSLTQNSLNSDVAGRYVFYARGGNILLEEPPQGEEEPDQPPGLSEPGTLLLAGAGLAGLAAGRRLRRRRRE